MIAETIPSAYDAEGRKVFRPCDRRKGLRPTFPLGRYVSHPLTVKCNTLDDVRKFLQGCQYVSDNELFAKDDYWQPPEEFEKRKQGDCDDFAFWAWRQLLAMDYDARVVFGQHGRYGIGHAWVQFFKDGKCYLLEPQARTVGQKFPRLSTFEYHPRFSVAWDGEKLSYYAHQDRQSEPSLAELRRMVPEYLEIWGGFWLRNLPKLPRLGWHLMTKLVKGFKWQGKPRSGN
jgi:hypothetical protein